MRPQRVYSKPTHRFKPHPSMHAWGKLYLGYQLCLDDVAELDRHSRHTSRAASYATRVWVRVVLVLSVTHARQFKRNRVTTTTSRNGCQNGTPRRQLHYPTRQPSGGHPPRTRQGILRLLEPPNSHSTWQRNPFQRLHVKIVIIDPYCEA